jgi:hypothetical protein
VIVLYKRRQKAPGSTESMSMPRQRIDCQSCAMPMAHANTSAVLVISLLTGDFATNVVGAARSVQQENFHSTSKAPLD